MACNISIPSNGVTGIIDSAGQLASIVVQGTAEDCKDCSNIIVSVNSSSTSAVFTDETHWTATINNPDDARCGEEVKVLAICESAPEFKAEWLDLLPCEQHDPTPSNCPTDVNITIEITDDCNEEGRLVNLDVSFVGTEPDGWQWQFGDGDNSPNVQSGQSSAISHRYPVDNSSYNGLLTLIPFDCSSTSFTVDDIEPCPPVECPEIEVKLKITNLDSGIVFAPDLVEAECLKPGKYEVEVVEPTGGSLEFKWFVNGNQQQDQTDKKILVELDCEEEIKVGVIVTVADDGCEYLDDVELTGCACPENDDITNDGNDNNNNDNDDEVVDDDDEVVEQVDPEWKINLCKIWFWVNVFLFVATGIFIFITLCLIEATVWSAIGAIGSGGTLSAVFGALSAVNITMLIISLVLIVLTLISFILWIIICAFGLARSNICPALTLLNDILSALIVLSFIVGIIFLLASKLGCAAGGFVDVAWFSILLSINWIVGRFLGCFR